MHISLSQRLVRRWTTETVEDGSVWWQKGGGRLAIWPWVGTVGGHLWLWVRKLAANHRPPPTFTKDLQPDTTLRSRRRLKKMFNSNWNKANNDCRCVTLYGITYYLYQTDYVKASIYLFMFISKIAWKVMSEIILGVCHNMLEVWTPWVLF